MTAPGFGIGIGPIGGMGYTGGPMFDPMHNSIPKFEPVIYNQVSIPRFDPIPTYSYESAPSFEEMFAKPNSYLDGLVTKIERTPEDPFGIIGGRITPLESTLLKKDYGIFNGAYGKIGNDIKHLFEK